MTEERKAKILCVEDEQDIRENIAEILRDEGFEVFEAINGKHGFEVFMQAKPDLIISDIMMPELDGYGLLKLVRESKNVRNNTVPFIFLSALGQKDDIIKGVNLSANDYLIKPIDFDMMIAKIREKTSNFTKLQEVQERNIKNLKTQVSEILPSELLSYLEVITQTITNLKNEPFGPMPHRRYLEEFDKIYLNSMRLRSTIANAFDESVIDSRLNTEEEVVNLYEFLADFISGLSDKFKNRIILEKPFAADEMSKVKIDNLVFLDALRKIFAGMFKSDTEASVKITMINDHLGQIAIIFYLVAKAKANLAQNIDEAQISKILDKQSCRFEIVEIKDNTAIFTIPSHRLVNR
jgi:CheY-like chemotaxis protein